MAAAYLLGTVVSIEDSGLTIDTDYGQRVSLSWSGSLMKMARRILQTLNDVHIHAHFTQDGKSLEADKINILYSSNPDADNSFKGYSIQQNGITPPEHFEEIEF